MNNFCLHVGVAKTGTSTLQNNFFSMHQDINYLGLINSKEPKFRTDFANEHVMKLVRMITREDSLSFNPSKLQPLFERGVRPYLKHDKITALSYEGLAYHMMVDAGLVAKRLWEIFGPAKIVITIRNQPDLIASLYLHVCRAELNRGRPIMSFEEWLGEEFRNRRRSIFQTVRFYQLVKTYSTIFGKENVAVFLMEDMVKNSRDFIRNICVFLQISESFSETYDVDAKDNERMSSRKYRFGRIGSELVPSLGWRAGRTFIPQPFKNVANSFLDGGRPARVTFPTNWHKRILNFYGEDNYRLSREFALPLGNEGYPIKTEGNSDTLVKPHCSRPVG